MVRREGCLMVGQLLVVFDMRATNRVLVTQYMLPTQYARGYPSNSELYLSLRTDANEEVFVLEKYQPRWLHKCHMPMFVQEGTRLSRDSLDLLQMKLDSYFIEEVKSVPPPRGGFHGYHCTHRDCVQV